MLDIVKRNLSYLVNFKLPEKRKPVNTMGPFKKYNYKEIKNFLISEIRQYEKSQGTIVFVTLDSGQNGFVTQSQYIFWYHQILLCRHITKSFNNKLKEIGDPHQYERLSFFKIYGEIEKELMQEMSGIYNRMSEKTKNTLS